MMIADSRVRVSFSSFRSRLAALLRARALGRFRLAMIDAADPRVARQIAQKRRLMARDLAGSSAADSRAEPASPGRPAPGNHAVKRWVVLDLGGRPPSERYDPWSSPDDHAIRFAGLGADGAGSRLVTLRELRERLPNRAWAPMPPHDWHCVTGWSALGLELRGAPLDAVLAHLERGDPAQGNPAALSAPRPDWTCLFQTSADGYETGVDRRDLAGAFLAVEWKPPSAPENAAASDDDRDAGFRVIPPEHGGPRLVFPALFGWKSAKWLSVVEFRPALDAGFWERLGCHPRARWAKGERWAEARGKRAAWMVAAGATDAYRVVFGVRTWEFVMVWGGWLVGVVARLAGALKRR